jgi:hypothetical protein
MVYRRVGRREPLSNILFDLVPCNQILVFTVQVMEEADHEHFISSMLFAISPVFVSIPLVFFAISPMFPAIATLAFAESAWTTVQRKVGNYIGGLRTLLVLNCHLPNLSYDHPDLLVYQTI